MPAVNSENILVIGAGITGLLVAAGLAEKGAAVTLFDSADKTGGLCGSVDLGGSRYEKYYHHVFPPETEVISLLDKLGLGSDFRWHNVSKGLFWQDRLRSLDHPSDFLLLTGISPRQIIGDIKLAMSLNRLDQLTELDGLPALEWIANFQPEIRVRKFWKPLIEKKFGTYTPAISAWWLADRLKGRQSSRGLFARGEKLGYLKGGFFRLAEALEKQCREQGVKIKTGIEVMELYGTEDKVTEVKTTTGTEAFSGIIISTIPLPVIGKVAAKWEGGKTAGLDYMGCMCVLLEVDRPVSPYYWITNLASSPFAAVIEHSKLFGDGRHTIYLPVYAAGKTHAEKDRSHLVDNAIDLLSKITPEFSRHMVTESLVSYDRFSQPVFTAGYLERRVDTSWWAGNLLVTDPFADYPEQTRSMNAAIRRAGQVLNQFSGG